MGLSTSGRNDAAGGVGAAALYVSMHTADPGGSGANEVAGGAYARLGATWDAASGGAIALTFDLEFDIPAGTTITHFGLYSALTAGTFKGSGALSASETFGGAGKYTLTAASVTIT